MCDDLSIPCLVREQSFYSAMLNIWEPVPHTKSAPTIPELTRSNSGIDTHNSAEFLPIPELHPHPHPHISSPLYTTEFRLRNSGIVGIDSVCGTGSQMFNIAE
ncbi:unnamed protein product [Adineta ricciae]|uniref:Uncharacterized protein n=1 Tax=Adineta ricciae TaxID=249248 RepID=A0A814XJU2_ADIRI|nr:unnamed protein product [Adineta ricciae]